MSDTPLAEKLIRFIEEAELYGYDAEDVLECMHVKLRNHINHAKSQAKAEPGDFESRAVPVPSAPEPRSQGWVDRRASAKPTPTPAVCSNDDDDDYYAPR